MVSSGCTLVEHSSHHLEVSGSSPDTAIGSGRKKTTTNVVAQWLSTRLFILGLMVQVQPLPPVQGNRKQQQMLLTMIKLQSVWVEMMTGEEI